MDTVEKIIDYFEPWDLVELLGLTTEDIVRAFPDEIEDKIHQLNELMGIEDDV